MEHGKTYFEKEKKPPGLGPLTPLGPHLQPLIGLLHCHEFVPALGVLVRVVLPGQLPASHHVGIEPPRLPLNTS